MAKIEIGFGTIICYVTFAMFVRVKCSWVNIDVGIKFLQSYLVPACLKQFGK